jgi:ribosomal protein L11 methylase PrmA
MKFAAFRTIQVVACDIDQKTVIRCQASTRLNNVSLHLADNVFEINNNDIYFLIATDVLCD